MKRCGRLLSGIGAIVSAFVNIGHAQPLVHEAVIDAPVEQVWSAFTTKEGLTAWMVPHAEIDLRVGGKMVTNYHADGRLGDEQTIENTILSFEPKRMLSLKATKAPADFPFKEAIKDMWSVIHFESLGPARTRVRTVGLGYGEDEESQSLRKFFERGNHLTLVRLREHFQTAGDATTEAPQPAAADNDIFAVLLRPGAHWLPDKRPQEQPGFAGHAAHMTSLKESGAMVSGGPFADGSGGLLVLQASSLEEATALIRQDPFVQSDVVTMQVRPWQVLLGQVSRSAPPPARPADAEHSAKALRMLQSLVGGEWIHEDTGDNGKIFRVLNVLQQGPHASCLVASAWLGDEAGMFYHGSTQIWIEPEFRELRFQNVNERGAISRGQIRLEADNLLLWDWNATEPDGTTARYEVAMVILGSDRYRFELREKPPTGEGIERVRAEFHRVAQAPDRFRRIRTEP